jgi:outer membrane immunogenic protein
MWNWIRRFAVVGGGVACLLGTPAVAGAQSWTGAYAGGALGGGFRERAGAERIAFDTNLDGIFSDTVRTVAGVDAFSPGFCGGLAVNATAAAGCMDDDNGVDVGGRAGYDWQVGLFVAGGLVDVSRTDVTDNVTAFSTTPAFYAFTRRLDYSAGFRGRAGIASGRLLLYGTGGAAWARIGQRFTTSNAVNTFVAINQNGDVDDEGFVSEGAWGYQAGGGAELRLVGRLTLNAEYLFSSFDNREDSIVRSQGPAPATNAFILVNPGGTNFQRTNRFEFQSVRVGLNVRF